MGTERFSLGEGQIFNISTVSLPGGFIIYELHFTNKVAIKLKENNTKMEHRHTHTQLN